MRVLGTVGLFIAIIGALCGVAYSAFVLMREGTFLSEQPIAVSGRSTVRVPAKAARPYWADVELASAEAMRDVRVPVKARVVDASGAELRVAEVSLEAKEGFRARIPPVVAKTDGDLTYEIEIGSNQQGGVAFERGRLIVYRSSREEVIGGLVAASVALILGGIVFRIARRRPEARE